MLRPLRGLPVRWRKTGLTAEPFEAEVEGRRCRLRVNDLAVHPFRYTLLVEGREVDHFNGWPVGWERSEAEPRRAVSLRADELEELRAQAEAGRADAQLVLGKRYLRGDGVPRDEEEAVRWLRAAADEGDPDAQYCLGLLFGTGRAGLPRDAEQAEAWLALSSAAGHPLAGAALRKLAAA